MNPIAVGIVVGFACSIASGLFLASIFKSAYIKVAAERNILQERVQTQDRLIAELERRAGPVAPIPPGTSLLSFPRDGGDDE